MVARPPSPVGALIPRFFAGRHVLITGATGFMGKVFDVIRQTNPAQLDKLRVIPGDVSEPGLGLPQSALQILKEVIGVLCRTHFAFQF
ncbi:hypothetical protein RR48_08561 [Papilio machaon]|uniref:Fatty acyl-CoA reductase n=1 Tax=Papilio machaon TaxID=76193 RepID=A0A194RJ59_PAPMA|nr:hypothetical protein RR48_08561 [Papilio machaon]